MMREADRRTVAVDLAMLQVTADEWGAMTGWWPAIAVGLGSLLATPS
jgi:hypothetical protein